MKRMTWTPKAADVTQTWWLVDAEGQTLGRLATRLATVLRGKHRPEFTPSMDLGDHIVVINAEKIAVTGNKRQEKMYRHHSGYPGGLREQTMDVVLKRHPDRVLRAAVKGMLPRGRLGRAQLDKLKIYAGPEHPHAGQKPRLLDASLDTAGAPTAVGEEG
jgi:large subunit ribosomal protein L13